MDDPEVCHLLLITSCLFTLLVDHAGQFAMAIMFVLPSVWYVRVSYLRHVESQVAGLWRERIRGVRG